MSRKFRLTREGRVFVVVTILVGVAAINTGNNLLYLVLSLLLGLLLLSGVLSDLSLYALEVELSLPHRLEVGGARLGEVALLNRKRWLSSFSISVSPLADGASLGEALFLKVGPGERAQTPIPLRATRRGELRIETIEIRTQYPFALVDKRRLLPARERALAHPRTSLSVNEAATERERGEAALSPRRGGSAEVIGLRELVPFEVASDLHFARSAALGRWVKRERGESRGPASVLVLDDRRDDEPDFDARFERRVEEAASLARALHLRGVDVGLSTSTSRVDPISRDRSLTPLLDALARIEPARDDEGVSAEGSR